MNTVEYLNNLGLTTTCIGDPAIFLKDVDAGLKPKKNISIGINAAYHGWTNQEKYFDKLIDAYSGMMKNLSEKYVVDFYYMKHAEQENLFVERLKNKSVNFEVVDFGFTQIAPLKMKNAYRSLDVFLGMMLHSTIFSFGTHTPFMNIGYDEKNKAFMDFINQNKYLGYSEVNATNLTESMENLLNNKSKIKKELVQKYEFIKEKKDLFLNEIVKLI